jgi:N-acetylmuramoyl-L-alanine amidase
MSSWDEAFRARVRFEAAPAGTHTRAGYTRVMDGFRAIYHEAPRDVHAADAVDAVAELLAEQGRELNDAGSLRNAMGQYEFLRTQYPGSGMRTMALLEEGRIAAQDLQDERLAREKFRQLLQEAPRSEAAAEARIELAGLGGSGGEPRAGNELRGTSDERRPAAVVSQPAAQGMALTESNALAVEAEESRARAARVDGSVVGDVRQPSSRPSESPVPAPPGAVPALVTPATTAGFGAVERTGQHAVAGARPVRLAQVTGIRHWSTATYTRVAIDLGDEVTFEAARVPNPDRIYFDLHGARLGAELVGKSFSVTDDGFLKRIRAAQQSPEVTRVVLDVNDVSEYSAFLLPNPYRLIIDIHGGRGQGPGAGDQAVVAAAAPLTEAPVAPADPVRASVAANRSGLPATAPTDAGQAVRPNSNLDAVGSEAGRALPDAQVSDAKHEAPGPVDGRTAAAPVLRPVPNTVAVKAPATQVEVAAVSNAPGRVEATSSPTSKPIAVGVPTVKDVTLGSSSASAVNPSRRMGRRTAKTAETPLASEASPAKAADKTADGETSMIRALGLKINRIVIDAGHGGHDSGTLGADGIEEKDVVLDVALRVGQLLHDRLGAEIIYTRSDDTFIPLETRTAIANKAQADLFLSIHANSSPDPTARGVETYYLNFTSDPTALDVAARENAVSGQSVHQLSDLVKKIALKDKIEESREFAADVEGSLYAGLAKGNAGLKDRGVKKAPFVVLIGANMPSILAEISFVTNPRDAAELRQPAYRERVAESLFAGVAKYESGLAGVKPAAPVIRASVR